MTMDRDCTGRSAMRTERAQPTVFALALALALAPACPGAMAAEPVPEPPPAAQAAQQVVDPQGLRARLLPDEISPVRSLAPAIFTELSPVTTSDPAVRLPRDQREAGRDDAEQSR